MKKSILVLSALLVSSIAFSQSVSCSYEKNVRGDSTEIITKPQVVHQYLAEYISLKGVKTKDGMFLRMETFKTEEIKINKSHPLQFTLQSKEVIKLFPVEEVVSKKDKKLNRIVVTYAVPQEKAASLKKHAIKTVRYTAETGFVEHQVKDKNRDKVSELITCLE